MKITFFYPDISLINNNRFNLGIAQLSAILKKEGFDTSLLHITKPVRKNELIKLVERHSPDMIAFSSLSTMFPEIKKYASWLKKLNIYTIYGGIHPTISPQDSIECDGIDAICRGEADEAMVDFCKKFKNGENFTGVLNFWVKEDGKIYKNAIRPVVEELDTLPFLDYSIFDYFHLKEGGLEKALVVQAARGCFYNCTYCSVHLLRSLVPNKNKYLRRSSAEKVIEQIKYGLKMYPFIKRVFFQDDTLTYNLEWFKDFAVKYKKEINLPFQCNDRVSSINEETSALLKYCDCERINLGIESGNEYIRNTIMQKHTSDEEIIGAFDLLRKAGVKSFSFNIFGMPYETPTSVLDTIKLNAKANPDDFYISYFYPFAGTQIYDIVVKNNYPIIRTEAKDFVTGPVVKLDTISSWELIFFFKYFRILFRLYRFFFKRFGEKEKIVSFFDTILVSKYFPHALLCCLFFSRDKLINFLQRYPKLYLYLRNLRRKRS